VRRLNTSLQHGDRESDDSDNDVVSDLSSCAASSSCDMSGVDLEQYCSLLESINSLLTNDKLETDSETENDRLDGNFSDVIDGDSCEKANKEDHQMYESGTVTKMSERECAPTSMTFNGSKVRSRKLSEKDIDGICGAETEENTDKIVNKLKSEMQLGADREKSDDKCRKERAVANDNVNSLTMESGSISTKFSTNSNANSSAEEDVSDQDENEDDDKPLVELCSKKAECENGFDDGEKREFSEGIKSDGTAASNQMSDDVLWKEGDIEVRLEIGEDESSNSPVCDDDNLKTSNKTSDLCTVDDNSDVPASKMPRTSIRISLSKLTARINGDDVAEPTTKSAPPVKELAVRRRGRPPKPKSQKKCMKPQQSRSDNAKTGKLSKTKADASGKLKHAQNVGNRTEVKARGRPRKSSQSVETAFSATMNGICTRRRHSTSDSKRVRSVDTKDVAESHAKSVLRDATVSKSKKRRASRGVEYIDDDVTSSLHHAADDYTHVNAKKKTGSNSHVEQDSSSVSFAEVDTNSQQASDKENAKCTMAVDKVCITTHSLNARKQTAGRKRGKSYSATCNINDVSTRSDGSVTDNIETNSMDDACAEEAVSFKHSRAAGSSIEENQTSSDNEEKSKLRCTTEEMFRQIGRDGLECRFCGRELRTRTQLLQHAKIQCHLQQKSSPSDADCFIVDSRKRHKSETEVSASQSESQCDVASESPKAGSNDADKKTNTIHVDAINGVHIKNCIIEISPITEKMDVKKESETDAEQNAKASDDSSDKANVAAAGDAMADCVCDGCGEVVPDCSWLTAHIVTCPGRSGAGDEISSESFHPDLSQWSSEQDNVLVPESGLEPVAGDASTQPVEVDAASLLQLLCTVENSLLCTVPSENDAGCQPITVVSDSLLHENGTTAVSTAESSHDVGQFGREVVHDGVAMYEFAEYRCSLCPVTFLDRAAAVRHATTTKVHTACAVEHTNIYCCMQCDMRYRDQQLMWYHVTYICQQSEAAAVPASEVHRCTWCTKQFLTAEYLSRHSHLQHSTELSNVDSQMTLREAALTTGQQSTITNTDIASSESQKQVLQALARATMRSGTNSSPKSRKEAALLRSKLVIASDTLPMRRTAKGIVYKNVFMQCIVSYICSNCGRDLSTKSAKREHRATAPDSCFDSGPGGRRLFTYVRHYSYLCPYCNERSATQKACRAHQLATCLPRMGVKTDELNHKQLLCPFCQRKYFNVITLKGHMTLVHQISRAESNQLLAGVTGASDEVGAVMPHDSDRTTVNTASLNVGSTALHQAAARPVNSTASVGSAADDEDGDRSAAEDDDSNSIKSESASHDSRRFETVDSTLPLFASNSTSSSIVCKDSERRDLCTSSDSSSENDDDEDEDVDVDSDDGGRSGDDSKSVQSPVLMRRRFSPCQKPETKKSSSRKS